MPTNTLEDFAEDEKVSPYTSDSEAGECCKAAPIVQLPVPGEEKQIGNLKQWAVLGSGRFRAVGITIGKLPPAMYSLESDNSGYLFVKRPIEVDNLIRFPDSLAESLLDEIDEFWSSECEAKFKHYGYLQRRGYLLYGPQGGGKTCICQLIVADIILRGGLVILANCHPGTVINCLQEFREVEPNRPIVCLFEDIDAIIHKHGEAELLSLLDGENQINKVISVASSNFPELLPKRIISRPRRFDRVIKIGFPPEEHRKIYFTNKLKIEENEVEKWVRATDGFSFAACAELVISVKCLGNSFEDTLQTLKKINEGKASSAEFDSKLGFVGFGNGSEQRKAGLLKDIHPRKGGSVRHCD
jgi:hypothetical protein